MKFDLTTKALATVLMMVLTVTTSIASAPSADSTRIMAIYTQIAAIDDHCEVPCGIYGDSLRIALIDEHIRTIEKATKKITELSAEETPNYNQLVRWVLNKEKHAEEIQHIVSQYFLHQRIKPTNMSEKKIHAKYLSLLEQLHHILVYSMKAKQGTSLDNLSMLKASVEAFEDLYFHKH